MNSKRKIICDITIILLFLTSIICLIVHSVNYGEFSVFSVPFWMFIFLFALTFIMYFIFWCWERHSIVLQARKYFQELQRDYTKYIVLQFPLNFNARNPLKRQFELTLYKDMDETLLLKCYGLFFHMAEAIEVENARIGDFMTNLQELSNIRGKTIVLIEGIYEDEKDNPVFGELFQNNRIITYDDCED